MVDEVGRAAVNVQPRERLAKNTAVRQRMLGARARGKVAHASLQPDNLPKPFDVAPCERQLP